MVMQDYNRNCSAKLRSMRSLNVASYQYAGGTETRFTDKDNVHPPSMRLSRHHHFIHWLNLSNNCYHEVNPYSNGSNSNSTLTRLVLIDS